MKLNRKRLAKHTLASIRAALNAASVTYSEFITTETYLKGKLFSFKDHEYEEYITKVIEENIGKKISISKCSQIGLSEILYRIFLARMKIRGWTHALLSFPSKSTAMEILKTRFQEVIDESPVLSQAMNPNIDSASVKAMRNRSIINALGGNKTQTQNSLLTRPIDSILIDERDRQDPDVISGYVFRAQHTPADELLHVQISTPTAQGVGIDADINSAYELHTPWVKCCHCQHEFIANFYKNVVLPGYRGPKVSHLEPGTPPDSVYPNNDLKLLNKSILSQYDADKAYLECPNCFGPLTQQTKETSWKITYNDKGAKNEIGITIDPFAAMGVITMAKLIRNSVEATSHVEFMNQGLGKVADKKDSTISDESIHFVPRQLSPPPGQHVIGLDTGKLCHFLHGVLQTSGYLTVINAEILKITEVEDFFANYTKKFAISAMVMDAGPAIDLTYRLVKAYSQMYSSNYQVPKSNAMPEMFKLSERDKLDEVVRQLTVNQPLAMDTFAGELPIFYEFWTSPYDGLIKKHLKDMRRVRDYSFGLEERYKWIKSDSGEDHFFHTCVYLFLAARLAMAGVNLFQPTPAPMLGVVNLARMNEAILNPHSRRP